MAAGQVSVISLFSVRACGGYWCVELQFELSSFILLWECICYHVKISTSLNQVRAEEMSKNLSQLLIQFAAEDLDKKVTSSLFPDY